MLQHNVQPVFVFTTRLNDIVGKDRAQPSPLYKHFYIKHEKNILGSLTHNEIRTCNPVVLRLVASMDGEVRLSESTLCKLVEVRAYVCNV